MSKLENYLKEYLKIVPEIQIKVKNKMDVIYKDDSKLLLHLKYNNYLLLLIKVFI